VTKRNPTSDADQGEHQSPYAGRWVATVRGQIAAQRGTPEQARHAAQASRHKETPEIHFMPPAEPYKLSPLLETIRQAMPADQEIYLVGGAVRDALLGRISHDLDFALPAGAIRQARRIADQLKAEFYVLDDERDTGRVILIQPDGLRDVMDFAAYRGPDLEADLRARDFSINAMALDIRNQSLFDPLSGAADLRAERIRACSPGTFKDDPVRILRGIRQAVAFGFQIDPATRKHMKAAVSLLDKPSPERLRDELFKMLEGRQPATAIRALDLLGALPHLLPELSALKGVEQPAPHQYDVWEHTLSALGHLESTLADLAPGYDAEQTSDLFTGLLSLRLGRYREKFAAHFKASINPDRSVRALLFFATLYHDTAKPQSRIIDDEGRTRFWSHDEAGAEIASKRAQAFNLSNDEVRRIKLIVRHHMRIHFHANRLLTQGKDPSRKAIYRFFRDSGEAGVDLVLLGLADTRATYATNLSQETWAACLEVARILLENYWEKPAETVAPPRLLNGDDLMRELDLQPGPQIGQLLESLREAQATGKVSTREQALTLAREQMAG
jgi:poly(A) polymerase